MRIVTDTRTRQKSHRDLYRIIQMYPCLVTLIAFFVPLLSFASVTLTYEYNALDRLSVAAYGTSFTETYTYDSTGNRTGLEVTTGQRLQKAPTAPKSTPMPARH